VTMPASGLNSETFSYNRSLEVSNHMGISVSAARKNSSILHIIPFVAIIGIGDLVFSDPLVTISSSL